MALMSARADYLETTGYRDLQARYGTDLASGSRITIAQVESPLNGAYVADTNLYPDKSFTFLSGPSQMSSHAQGVAVNLFSPASAAHGATNIHAYEAIDFITNSLLTGTASAPLSPLPARVFNHSWVTATHPADNDVLRRIDHVIDTYGITMAAGVANGAAPLEYWLLGQSYNVIAVGSSTTDSRYGPTSADAAGRAKPDIVAPVGETSSATPAVAASAAILIDRSLSSPTLTNAADPRVIKALLLTAAEKPHGWHKGGTADSDDSAVPLDWRYGAGDLRINRAYDLLNSGEVVAGLSVTNSAWDLGTTVAGSTNWYFFSLDPTNHASLKATLAWHRRVDYKKQGPFNLVVTVTTQNLDLALFTASGATPLSRVAVSTSAVDNVEHLWVTNFSAGTYALGVAGAGEERYGLAFDAVPAPTISIEGSDTNAAESGPDVATFLARRDGSTELQTTVHLSASGTASNGLDYVIPSTVIFTAGQTIAGITLAPITDSGAEGSETATISIAPGVGYALSQTNQATALIADLPLDQWRFESFTPEELVNATISGDWADPDGDGANLFDYDAANSPKVFSQDLAGRVGVIQDGGQDFLSLVFTRRQQASDITNIVEVSGDLMDWLPDAIQVGTPVAGTNGTETVIFRDSTPMQNASRRFIRRRIDRIVIP